MAYYMRFLVTDPGPIDLAALGAALRATSAAYEPRFKQSGGTLNYSGVAIASVSVMTPEDEGFEDELAELEEVASAGAGPGEAKVADTLATTQAIVVVQVLAAAADPDGALESLDPMWEWFFSSHHGLLQADAEGYYDKKGLIFEVD